MTQTNKMNTNQCEFGSKSDPVEQCQKHATTRIGGVKLCKEHGDRKPKLVKEERLTTAPPYDQTDTQKMREDLQTFRIALADAIRRPMGVIPETAEGLLSFEELDAAERRRTYQHRYPVSLGVCKLNKKSYE